MSKDITPRNEKSQCHGLCEWYHSNGKLYLKGKYINGDIDGYWEIYDYNGQLRSKLYYI